MKNKTGPYADIRRPKKAKRLLKQRSKDSDKPRKSTEKLDNILALNQNLSVPVGHIKQLHGVVPLNCSAYFASGESDMDSE